LKIDRIGKSRELTPPQSRRPCDVDRANNSRAIRRFRTVTHSPQSVARRRRDRPGVNAILNSIGAAIGPGALSAVTPGSALDMSPFVSDGGQGFLSYLDLSITADSLAASIAVKRFTQRLAASVA
jgi:hypothetical protein